MLLRLESGIELIYYNKKKFYSNLCENGFQEFGRGNIFYSNWSGLCKKKRKCYILDFGKIFGE
jgi:hypothetical protein